MFPCTYFVASVSKSKELPKNSQIKEVRFIKIDVSISEKVDSIP